MIENKNIVLTGADSGIGLEVLKLLLKGGNKVLAVDVNTGNLDKIGNPDLSVLKIDVSSQSAVDEIFDAAEKLFGKIDIFYANAGYPYYEVMDYADWNRVASIFETNVFSPIYSYQKYVKHLNGRKGVFAITVSAIGQMAMPGFTLYSASKFAMHGFQQALRFEIPDNVQLTCLYPVATNTNFFKAANSVEFDKPFPVQEPAVVAKKMVEGIEKGKKSRQSLSPFRFVSSAYEVRSLCKDSLLGYGKQQIQKIQSKNRQIIKEKTIWNINYWALP